MYKQLAEPKTVSLLIYVNMLNIINRFFFFIQFDVGAEAWIDDGCLTVRDKRIRVRVLHTHSMYLRRRAI